MSVSVERGAMANIMAGSTGATGYNPTVQVVSLKKLGTADTASDRWRLVLSDGQHFAQSMLATQQNEMITSGELQELCLVTLMDYIVNVVRGKKLIIVLKLEVRTGPQPKIGEPTNVADDPAAERAPTNSMNSTGPYGNNASIKSKPASNPYGGTGGTRQASNNYGGGGGYGTNNSGGYGNHSRSGAVNPYNNTSRRPGANSGPVQRQSQDDVYMPISALNPYQNRWTIKARVTNKSDIRRWSNARGEGWLFSVDLLDEAGSEIRGTFFKQDADRWHDVLQRGHVYSFSGGRIKVANKQYTSLASEYEITFDSNTDIIPIQDDNRIQSMTFKFVKLSEMEGIEPNTVLDTIAIVKAFEECTVINTKAGKEVEKRNLTLVDDTCTEITITLWGASAKEDGGRWEGNPVVAFKGVKLSDFSGRSLSSFNSSTVVVSPGVPEADELRGWFTNAGSMSSFKSVSVRGEGGGGDELGRRDIAERYTLESIRERNLGHGEKADYAMVKAVISSIKVDSERGPWYTACPNEGCNKKVTGSLEQGWACEKCNQTFADCKRRFILMMTISDNTGRSWVTAFNDMAVPIMGGATADDLNALRENGEEAAFEEAFKEACFQSYLITLRVKAEMVNDEQRIKNTIQRMVPLDFKAESEALLDAIARYD